METGFQNANRARVAVIIPTYNERGNIDRLVRKILALPLHITALVIDDNSPDGTGQLLDEMAAAEPRLKVIHRPAKLGLGTAHIAGLKAALREGAEFAITMDADFSHNPDRIPDLLKAAAAADVAIGSRYVPGGRATNSPLYRVLLSRSANFFSKILLGVTAGDCTAGFRCYRAVVLKTIDLDSVFSEGYSFLIEMLYKAQVAGFRITEVPIEFVDRACGVSKISKREILSALGTVARLAFFCRAGAIFGFKRTGGAAGGN